MTWVERSFGIAQCVSRTALQQVLARGGWHRHAILVLRVGHLFEHAAQPRYFLLVEGHPCEPQDSLTSPGPKDREGTLHFGFGNGHFRTSSPDMVNCMGYGGAVFLTACAGLIIGGHDHPSTKETPELYRVFLLFRPSPKSFFCLHDSFPCGS